MNVMPIHRDRLNMTDRFLKTVRRVKLKNRMLEICKSGSVRGIEVFSHGLNNCDTPQTERAEKQGIQNKPKGKDHIMSTRQSE